MIRVIFFFLLIFLRLKESYIFSWIFNIGPLEIFILSIPVFSIVLISFIKFEFFNYFEKKRKILISLILLTFSLSMISNNRYIFLFFLEFCSFLIIFLILDLSKDYDKFTSIIFIITFNMIGSLPFFFVYFCSEEASLYSFFNLICSSRVRLIYFFFVSLILARKLPIFFFHFWLTKAHVRASGVCSIILAGLILKLGRFGMYKFYPFLWEVGKPLNSIIIRFTLLSVLNFRILIIRFFDLKYFVACSSVVHIALSFPLILRGSVNGIESRIIMIVGHGLISFFLFFLVSIIYEFSHNRSFDFSKSLESLSKFFCFLFYLFFFLNIGVPPFLNFFRELLTFLFILKDSFYSIIIFFVRILISCLYLMFCLTKESFRKVEKFIRLENFSYILVIFFFYFFCYLNLLILIYFYSLFKNFILWR